MILYFTPFECVGEFRFNTKISCYLNKYEFDILLKEKEYQSNHYTLKEQEVTLFVEENIIDSICCNEECLYKGRNLIGMTIEEFVSHTGEKYYGEIDKADFEDDNIPQYIYEFDDIGLQVWVKNNKIVTVIASAYIEDE